MTAYVGKIEQLPLVAQTTPPSAYLGVRCVVKELGGGRSERDWTVLVWEEPLVVDASVSVVDINE